MATLDLVTILSALTTVFGGTVAWFIRGIYSEFKALTATVTQQAIVQAVHEEKINTLFGETRQIRSLILRGHNRDT